MADGVEKGVYSWIFGFSQQISWISFLIQADVLLEKIVMGKNDMDKTNETEIKWKIATKLLVMEGVKNI